MFGNTAQRVEFLERDMQDLKRAVFEKDMYDRLLRQNAEIAELKNAIARLTALVERVG